jgi:hypothetical protein
MSDERSEKNELAKAFSASNVGNLDYAAVGRMQCSCSHTHPSPAASHPNPTDSHAHTSPANCGCNRK